MKDKVAKQLNKNKELRNREGSERHSSVGDVVGFCHPRELQRVGSRVLGASQVESTGIQWSFWGGRYSVDSVWRGHRSVVGGGRGGPLGGLFGLGQCGFSRSFLERKRRGSGGFWGGVDDNDLKGSVELPKAQGSRDEWLNV
jgi:hypothetical protein